MLWIILLHTSPLTGTSITYLTARPQQKGHTYLCLDYQHYNAHTFWNTEGKRCEAYNEFEIFEYNLYAEHGLNCNDTLSFKGAWAKINESINGKTFGFKNLRLGWKHYLGTKRKFLISTELVGIIPVKKTHKPGLCYGQSGSEVNVLLTKDVRLWARIGNCNFKLGYRKYSGFPSDQILMDSVINIFLSPRLLLSAGSFLEYGLFNGKSRNDESFFLLRSNYRLLQGKIQAAIRIYKESYLFIGYHEHFWGRNAGTNGGIYGGAQIQF